MVLDFQPQSPSSFPNASTVNISNGTFNDIKGNSYTYYFNNTYQNITNSPPRLESPRLCPPATSTTTHNSAMVDASGSPSPAVAATEICVPNLFPVVENTLELITHLVDVPTGSRTLFHRLSSDLRDLVQLVAMSSVAYQACAVQTPIGRLIRNAIDGRLSICNRRLVTLHQEMLGLPHRSVPLVRSVCRTLYQWWTANEPEEITAIRSRLNAETTAFGEWLLCLKSSDSTGRAAFSWLSPSSAGKPWMSSSIRALPSLKRYMSIKSSLSSLSRATSWPSLYSLLHHLRIFIMSFSSLAKVHWGRDTLNIVNTN
ncbi:hypothetical protein BKA70DRAFT_186759 [Coprinopsis sp. MPI-PUGE-AT-0042]|nr:hypothetical protein BKA70DRAFT_186759 [Coprinopsis sp. MPI-PUGE-AT-0042]